MGFVRSVAVGPTMLGFLGNSTVSAPGRYRKTPSRRLDADSASVQFLLGVANREARPWGSRVEVDRAEVLDVEGHRLHEKDRATAARR
jgi:hypothetical protein